MCVYAFIRHEAVGYAATFLSVFISTGVGFLFLLWPTKNMYLLHVSRHCMSHIRVRERERVRGLHGTPLLLSILFMAPSPFYCKTSSALLSLAIITYTASYRASLLWGLHIKHTQEETRAHMVHTHARTHLSLWLASVLLPSSYTFLILALSGGK